MKNIIITLMLIATQVFGQIAVHDPAQTAATIAEMQKQLDEWAKQHESMVVLNDLTEDITEYSKNLNEIVGTGQEAIQKLRNLESMIGRLKDLTSIKDPEALLREIADLSSMTEIVDVIGEDEIYGNVDLIKDSDDPVHVQRYKRYAAVAQKSANYVAERTVVTEEMSAIQTELAEAMERAQEATTQADLLAHSLEVETINARLNLLILRFDTAYGDFASQVMSNQNRDYLEQEVKTDNAIAIKAEHDAIRNSNLQKANEKNEDRKNRTNFSN